MMVSPTREDNKMHEILDPWLRFDGQRFVLKEGAPQVAKDMYEIYWQKYGKNFG